MIETMEELVDFVKVSINKLFLNQSYALSKLESNTYLNSNE
jgi:hypothetical protein